MQNVIRSSLFRSCSFFFLLCTIVKALTLIVDVCVFTCRAILKINNSRRGYWVSGLIFFSWKYYIYRHISFIQLCTENVPFVFWIGFRKGVIKRKKGQSEPKYILLTFSEVLSSYVWYQTTLSLSLLRNVGPTVWFFKFVSLSFLDFEFEKRSFNRLNIPKC